MKSVFYSAAIFSLIGNLSLFAEDKRSLQLLWENDSFLDPFGRYTDRHYTNGIILRYMHRDNELNGNNTNGFLWSNSFMNSLWHFGMDIERTRGGFGFGQKIYTPEDISLPRRNRRSGVGISRDADQLQQDDRPYAGYLFVESYFERRGNAPFLNSSIPTRDRFNIALGIVGPSSFAEDTQTRWHDVFHGPIPDGWDFQLNDELTLMLSAERSWLHTTSFASDSLHLDIMPTLGFDLGNVFTRLSAKTEIRLGMGEIHDFTIPSMQAPNDNWGVYLFGSVQGFFVAHNIFLDGNTFTDSHSVDKENFVGEFSLGIGTQIGCLEAKAAWVRRSKEFKIQDVPNSYLSFLGTIYF